MHNLYSWNHQHSVQCSRPDLVCTEHSRLLVNIIPRHCDTRLRSLNRQHDVKLKTKTIVQSIAESFFLTATAPGRSVSVATLAFVVGPTRANLRGMSTTHPVGSHVLSPTASKTQRMRKTNFSDWPPFEQQTLSNNPSPSDSNMANKKNA